MKEKELVQNLCNRLDTFFDIYTEITGYYRYAAVIKKPVITGKKNRIDIIVQHKKEKDLIFGIECKRLNYKKGNDLGKLMNQAGQYAESKFSAFGRIPILIYPSITGNYLNEAKKVHEYYNPHNHVTSMLFTVKGIGEVKEYINPYNSNALDFVINNVRIWHSYDDQEEHYCLNRYKRALEQIDDRLEKNRGYMKL